MAKINKSSINTEKDVIKIYLTKSWFTTGFENNKIRKKIDNINDIIQIEPLQLIS